MSGIEITVRPHESFEGRYKWRVVGVGLIQRSGNEGSAYDAYMAAEAVVNKCEHLRLVK